MTTAAEEARARRLAAIEARLGPAAPSPGGSATPNLAAASTTATAGNSIAGGSITSSTSSGDGTPSRLGTGTPVGGPPRHLAKGWTRPSAAKERERRRELARVLQRSIVRDSGYAQAAGCVETLLKIATNIQNNSDEKFRKLKGDNSLLKSKVLSVPGGREFLILMGFHTETIDFVLYFIIDQSERRMYELGLAAEILQEALPDLQSRVSNSNVSKVAHKTEEAIRVAAAKRQIEDDRQLVQDRVERERTARMAREQAARDLEARQAEREAAESARLDPDTGNGAPVQRGVGDFRPPTPDPDASEEEDDAVYGRRNVQYEGHRWGTAGQKLGEE